MVTPSPDKSFLTPAEVARALQVAPVTVRRWSQHGLLEANTTPGGHRRYAPDVVERFAAAHGIAVSPTPRTGVHVLVVDDNRELAGVIAELLELAGAVTAQARDGFEAGTQLHRFRPHVVLLDLMMPGLDGFAVCERIKADPATRDTRVIAMTGYHTEDNVRRIVAAGAECCLAKPLDHGALMARLGLRPGRIA